MYEHCYRCGNNRTTAARGIRHEAYVLPVDERDGRGRIS